MIVAIDGPAGAGKSTVARELAHRLRWLLIDTGMLYRALAWAGHQQGILPTDETALANLVKTVSIRYDATPTGNKVFVEGVDVSHLLRTPEVSKWASVIAQYESVREALLPLQRLLASKQSCVVEGRDIGTVVLPAATVKFFLTARPEIRSKRRYDELQSRGITTTKEQVLQDQTERDKRDEERAASPTLPASDAILLDTSDLTFFDVVTQMEAICIRAQKNQRGQTP